jgi:hypothetical protein
MTSKDLIRTCTCCNDKRNLLFSNLALMSAEQGAWVKELGFWKALWRLTEQHFEHLQQVECYCEA